MKRKLYLVGLVALVLVILVPLVFGGCVSTKKDTDTATPTLESVAADVATLKSQSSNYATQSQLSAFASQADLDASKAEFESLLEEMMTGISTPDLSNYVTRAEYDAMVATLTARIEELEGNGGGTNGGGEGEVTVALDTENVTFVTNSTASHQMFPVRIVNGTDDYQQVKFGLIMQCITSSPDNTAENTVITSVLVNSGTPFTINMVPSSALCQLVYFTWTTTDSILVAPSKESIVYVYINGIATDYAEVWQISLTSIITTKL